LHIHAIVFHAFEPLMSLAGVDMVPVPHKGGGQAPVDPVWRSSSLFAAGRMLLI